MDLPPENPSANDHTPETTTDPARAAALFEQSAAIMARLRAPGGCPWDREQSFDSIRKYTLEEVYEVFDAIERRDFEHLAEELGDLLLQVLFYAEMAANEGFFSVSDVLEGLNRKLIRRHPHVFGDEASRAAGNRAEVDIDTAGSAAGVLRNWEEIKAGAAKKHRMQRTRLQRKSNRCRGSTVFFARCPRWLNRPSSARRRKNPASIGQAGASCCPKSRKRLPSWRLRRKRAIRGRSGVGRLALHRRQSRTPFGRRCGDGAA